MIKKGTRSKEGLEIYIVAVQQVYLNNQRVFAVYGVGELKGIVRIYWQESSLGSFSISKQLSKNKKQTLLYSLDKRQTIIQRTDWLVLSPR